MKNKSKNIIIFIIIWLNTFLYFDAYSFAEGNNDQDQINKIDSVIAIIKNHQNYKNDSVFRIAKQALYQSKVLSYKEGINQCYFHIAKLYELRSYNDSAIKYYSEGLEYVIPYLDSYADFLYSLSNVYRISGDYSFSLEKSLKLKELVENHSIQKYSYHVYNQLALCYMGLMEYDLALENFNKSAELAIKNNNEAYAGVVYSNIGNLYHDQYKLNEALQYFEKGISIEKKYNLYRSLGNSYNVMANIYIKLNNETLTQFYLTKANEYNLMSENQVGLAKTYYSFSKVYAKKNSIDSAIYYLNKTVKIASNVNAKTVLKDAYYSLSELYSRLKDYEKAYHYHDLFFTVYNNIYDIKEINKAKTSEQKLIQQEKENELYELELRKQETINKLLILMVCLIIFFTVTILIYLFRIKKLNRDLIISKNKAEESDKLKSRFLQTISHEIRTPLNGIIGFSEMIRTKKLKESEMNTINEMINKNSEDLISTIENMVDIAHLSTNQFYVRKTKFELIPLLEDIVNRTRENIVFKNKEDLEIILDCNEDITLNTDKNFIHKIILHLVKNAVQYTEKGIINISYKTEKSNLILYVKDTGIGISKEKIDIIFSPFQQANENINIKVGGTGLGLTIVNGLIQILGGKIWVGSELEKGSTFYLSLPLK